MRRAVVRVAYLDKGEQILRSKESLVQQLITYDKRKQKLKKTDLLIPTTSQNQGIYTSILFAIL